MSFIPTHRHIKRNSYYREIERGFMIEATCQSGVYYQALDGTKWIRPASEFDDPTRFEKLATRTVEERLAALEKAIAAEWGEGIERMDPSDIAKIAAEGARRARTAPGVAYAERPMTPEAIKHVAEALKQWECWICHGTGQVLDGRFGDLKQCFTCKGAKIDPRAAEALALLAAEQAKA